MSLRIVDVDPQSGDALSLLREAAIEARALYPDAVPPDAPWPTNAPSGARDAYVVAYLDQQPVACGALREIDLVCAEVRRMYVLREHRRHRIGYTVLSHLVARGAASGIPATASGDRPQAGTGDGALRSLWISPYLAVR